MEVHSRRHNRFDVLRYGTGGVARRRARARNNWSRLRSHIRPHGPSNRYSRVIRSRVRWLKLQKVKAAAMAIRSLKRTFPNHIVREIFRRI